MSPREMAEWQNGGMAERPNGGLCIHLMREQWREMAEWRIIDSFDERAVEKNGGMVEWRNGGMADY